MDAATRERLIETVKSLLRESGKHRASGDIDKARSSLETAQQLLESNGVKEPWTKTVGDALKSLDDESLKQGKKDKCDYRALGSGEIKKLKANGEDPHDIKGYDSEADLFKCKPSGKIAIGRKSWHQDDKGNWLPGGTNYEDTGINIDDMGWPKQGKSIMDETIIELRIGGFKTPVDELLPKLPLAPDKVHRKGEKRGSSRLVHKEDWFVYSAKETQQQGFVKSVAALVEKLQPASQKLRDVCGPHTARLSCIVYFKADHRPVIHFPSELLTKLNELGVAIDVDLYPLPPDE